MSAPFHAEPPVRRNIGALARLVSFVVLVLFAAASAWAGTYPVFGPEKFVLTPGRNVAFTRTFSAPSPGAQYFLRARVENVSNAKVLLNGAVVLGSSDLDRSISVVQKQVQLSKDNLLSVELSSLNATITIDIYGIDDQVPTITSKLSRAPNGADWFASDVTVSFLCADAISGIAGCTAPATISSEGATQVTGVATDLAGNSASTRIRLNIDKTPPIVGFSEPAPGSTVTTPAVSVRGTIQDGVSGLKNASCNGQAVVVSENTFSCVVRLAQGENQVRVLATDMADNTGSATLQLKYAAATSAPAIVILSPATLTSVNAASVDVTGAVQTSKPGSLQVQVNGVAATLSATAPAGFQRSFTAQGVPLREGQNIISATASDGGKAAGSIVVTRDSSAPMLAIDTPADGTVVSEPTVTVAGRAFDVIGPVLATDVAVSVNGQAALVRNGSFLAPDLPLVPGPNLLTVIARDGAGNARSAAITVSLDKLAGQRITMTAGNRQQGVVGSVLPSPFMVLLTDSEGKPVAGRNVAFRVLRGDGSLLTGSSESRSLFVATDANGAAQVSLRLGSRSGAGNNIVLASAVGFAGTALFVASANPGPAVGVKAISGDSQIGVPGQLLPTPFVTLVHDAAGNPVPGVLVTYAVLRGGGKLDAQESLVRVSGSDGRATTVLTLGTQEGLNNHSVSATIPALTGLPVVFTASTPASTSTPQLRGLVLDESNTPISGVTARVSGMNVQASSGADGQFTLTGVPAGKITLEIDGRAIGRAYLSFDFVAQPGQDNHLPSPIFLALLGAAGNKTVGGSTPVSFVLPNIPSATLTVAPNSVTCPNGSPVCEINFAQVHSDKLPLAPPAGITPKLAWTIQPSGVSFDPPARLTLPNAEGLRPGQIVDLFTFDYGYGQFVSTGTAMVSEDGAVITSDVGTGIARSGWGFVQSPPTALGCALSCEDGNSCTIDTKSAPCFCEHTPRQGGCEDGLFCTSADGINPGPDACDVAVGGCRGKTIPDKSYGGPVLEADFAALTEFLDKLNGENGVAKKVEKNLPKSPGLTCNFAGPSPPSIEYGADIYSRCCEDEDKIKNGGLNINGTATLPIAGVECGLFADFKLLSAKLVIGLGGSVQLETSGNFSPCTSDTICVLENSAKGVLEVYVEGSVEVLKGFAGASLRGSASASIGPKQTCQVACAAAVVSGTPDTISLAGIPMSCSTTVEMCFGPVVASGRVKLFGFIKIGFTYRVPNTTWCTEF